MGRAEVPRPPTGALLTVRLGERHGVDPQVTLRGSGLEVERLGEPQVLIRPSQELVVVGNLVAAVEEAALGIEAGGMFRLSSYGVWGFALLSGPTPRSVIDVALEFVPLTFAFCDISGRAAGEELEFVVSHAGLPAEVRRFLVERDMAGVWTIQRDFFARPLPLTRVEFTFPAPPVDVVEHYTRMFGVEPRFDAAENLLAVRATDIDVPLPQADEATWALAVSQLEEMRSDRLSRRGVAGEVRALLAEMLSARVTATDVAAALHLSERRLRERLAREGTSFRALLEEVRERRAEDLLARADLSIAAIADHLGYVEVSSFSQAFRRWKGMSPRAWRARRPESAERRNE